MTKREKVIIGIMLAVAVLGAYSLFFPSSETTQADSEKVIQHFNSVIADLAKKIKSDSRSNASYVLQLAAAEWEKDPFVPASGYTDAVAQEERNASEVSASAPMLFSGFVEVGDKMLAVINGLEYEEGDMMGQGGYKIRKISRENVVLEAENGEELVLLIEEY